jgi:hypothetical protein
VIRPSWPSSKSESARSSSTLATANVSGVARAVVASSASAFAPFSQNSNRDRCAAVGSGHAQPGQRSAAAHEAGVACEMAQR